MTAQRVGGSLLALWLAAGLVFAHGGRLDRNGGHFNRKTGVYHCHRCPCGCDTKSGGATTRQGFGTSEGARSQAGNSSTKVWVNTSSGVYHCPGTRWYGSTKRGEFMTQGKAQASGYRPAYGNTCP